MKVYVHTINGDLANYHPDLQAILYPYSSSPRKVRGARSMSQIRAERRKAIKTRRAIGCDDSNYGVCAIEITEGGS